MPENMIKLKLIDNEPNGSFKLDYLGSEFKINTPSNVFVDLNFFCFDIKGFGFYDFSLNEYYSSNSWREKRLKTNKDLGFKSCSVKMLSENEISYPFDKERTQVFNESQPVFIYDYSWGHNYQHWLLTCVPRLFLFLELKKTIPNLKVLHNFSGAKFKNEVFSILGIQKADIVHHDTLKIFSEVYIPSFNGGSGKSLSSSTFKSFQKIGGRYAAEINLPTEKLYIIRDDTLGKRPLRNRSVLNNMLLAKGFTVIDPSKKTLEEKISLFRGAKIIVGDFSAGWGHIVFCSPGTKLVLIEHDIYKFKQFYSELCENLSCDLDVVETHSVWSKLAIFIKRCVWHLSGDFESAANSATWNVDIKKVKEALCRAECL
jgi:hypothetical protein